MTTKDQTADKDGRTRRRRQANMSGEEERT